MNFELSRIAIRERTFNVANCTPTIDVALDLTVVYIEIN